jgi:hypothetical protein
VNGEAQAERTTTIVDPRASWHSKVAPGSALNDHAGERSLPSAGGAEPIVGGAGAVVSRVYAEVAACPTFPPASTARALKV